MLGTSAQSGRRTSSLVIKEPPNKFTELGILLDGGYRWIAAEPGELEAFIKGQVQIYEMATHFSKADQ
jgi:hypothetical protein